MEEFAKGTRDGWVKYEGNPVLGGELGVCFDITLLKDSDKYRMWFSWRSKKSVALTESSDGIHWSHPVICLEPADSGWEDEINRCSVVFHDGKYHMWYTGQIWETISENKDGEGIERKISFTGQSKLGYATSDDGIVWKRYSANPVMTADHPWEKVAVMCPHVLWDEAKKCYCMWYSGGEQYEPNAIGYAESHDGIKWNKYNNNPVLKADPHSLWEQHKCTACQVIKLEDWYYMFYIGFQNEDYAQIGVARSKDGINGWERSKYNPIIAPDEGNWDGEACYKPFVIYEPDRKEWLLWYNGRKGNVEQIGFVKRPGKNLTF
jgi:sucrose-6-phosphate hydrolase SacC (GH32 family)